MPPAADGVRHSHVPAQDGVRRIAVPLGERFAAAPSYNAEARTVELIVATDTPVRMPGWFLGIDAEYYLEVLDCTPAAVDFSEVRAGNCPMLDAHNRWSIADQLGVIRDGRCEDGKVIVVGAFGQSERAKATEADVAAGTPPKVSAGYRRDQMIFERFEGDIPVYRVTRWTLREASWVPIAADPNAGVRSDGTVFPCAVEETRAMPPEQQTAADAATDTSNNANTQLPDGQRAATPAAPPAPPAPPLARFTASSALALVAQARAFGESVVTRASELIAQNERGEIGMEAARSEILQAAAESQRAAVGGVTTGGRPIEVTADESAKWMRGAENSIIVRAGLADTFRAAAKIRGETIDLDPSEFRGMRNVDLARMALERMGHRMTSYDPREIVGAALTVRMGPAQTTSDFPKLLENIMNKTLQAAYIVTPDTWRRFCGTGSVNDFRPHPRYLRGTFGSLDEVLEDGEFKNKAIPDAAKESIRATTKGNIVALSRQAIINDDMNAFSSITTDLARAAKLSVEKDVYALLALNAGLGPLMGDGLTLFHASHGNIAAVAAAPSVASVDAMRVMIASQTDVSGNEILDLAPSIWLGPIGIGGTARVVNNSEYDPDTANKLQRFNIARSVFRDIVDTARLTGTRWYAFTDPDVAPAIEVVFLDGMQEPYTEMRDGWRVDGTEWKVRFDYGVGGLNWRSAATNAGA